jgi:hypothetical protein
LIIKKKNETLVKGDKTLTAQAKRPEFQSQLYQ